jgi:hypothetical protein
MHQKVNVCILFNEGSFEKFKFNFLLSSLVFIFFFPQKIFYQKIFIKKYYNTISMPWAFAFFYHSTSFACPTAKPVITCHWIIQAFKYVFLGPRTP